MSAPTDRGPDPHADPLIASVMRAAGAVTAKDCPDAELLALYAEHELSSDERGPVEAHVAGCDRCQATIAAFVRGAPEPGVPEPAGGIAAPAWWAGWRWMVPLASATAVAAVAVWIGRGPADQAAPAADAVVSTPARVADAQAPGDSAALSSDALSLERREPAGAASGRVQPAPPREPRAASAAQSKENDDAKRVDERAAGGARDVLAKAQADQVQMSRQRVNPNMKRDAPPPPPAAPAVLAAPAAAVPAEVAEAPARAENVAGQRLADAATSALQGLMWRVRDGIVERSPDQGVTWTRTASPTPERLTAVTATGARSAVVTTVAGTRFSTTDGGATWRNLP